MAWTETVSSWQMLLSGLETKEFFIAQNLRAEEPPTVMSEQTLEGSGALGAQGAWGGAQEQE